MSIVDAINGRVFNLVHRNSLVYNTCWEDPRLDRVALRLGPADTVLMITSAGCNALDYALCGPKHVYAVDLNPRQNALLELKLSGIRNLEFEDFFAMFGRGRHAGVRTLYRARLRAGLSPRSQRYWDRRIGLFDHPRRSFYFRGTSGFLAQLVNLYIDRVARLRPSLEAILVAENLDQQRQIYDRQLREQFWSRSLRFFLRRDAAMSLVGVPPAQRMQVDRQYEGGLVQFIEDCLEAVFARLPLADNYFWRVYTTGRYEPHCCPEYLKPENFQRLKDGQADCISTHTGSLERFLSTHDVPISRFVLLDHMDWLADKLNPHLEAEWQVILRRATSDALIIWRSGGLRTEFVDRARVEHAGRVREVGELLSYDRALAAQLHELCRVHTYGSFHIAHLAA